MTSALQEYYVDNQQDFEEVCDSLKSESRLALDTEFERRNTYYPILALLQIATPTDSILIDPLKISNWRPFIDLLNANIQFVMHSCSEDLEVFRRFFKAQPRHLVDTQIACAFLGKGEALGYANMVRLLRNVELDKSETRSNWMQRPLTDSQKHYAREDVRWLLGIYEELEAELLSRGRLEWVLEEFSRLRDRYLSEPQADEHWLRIKGTGRMHESSWPLVYALADWREKLCRSLDKPRGWIMKDPELLEIATQKPINIQQLGAIKGVTSTTLKRNSTAILDLTQSVHLPEPPTRPVPELDNQQRSLLKRLQLRVLETSEALELAARFIANKQDLAELIQYKQGRSSLKSSILTGWRGKLIGRELEEIISASNSL